jgi:uncharacterized SAM-binding protein YcdF (DUF218 family)
LSWIRIRERAEESAVMDSSPKPLEKRKRRGWRYGVLAVVFLAVCLYGFRAPILRSVAGYLVVEDPPAAADYVLVQPYGDGRYDRAAELYHSGLVHAILLVHRPPSRLERMGLLPTFETLTQHALVARGVPAQAITVLPGPARTDWERARWLRAWLEHQPPVHVIVFSDRFGGRKLRYIFDQMLGPDYAGCVRLLCLPGHRYDENNWWHQRTATVDIFDTYVRLAFTRLVGEGSEEWREWDPKEYEKKLRQR